MNESSTLQRPGFSILAHPISSLFVYLTLFPTFVSAQLTVVSPGEFATTEAPDVADLTNFPSYRFQQVYGASDFESVGPGPYTITRIDWRPGSEMTETIDYPSDQFLMRFATTNVDPALEGDVFDRTFENNIHANDRVVFDGPLTMTTSNVGPAEGPKEFDYGLDLATPYVYDPTDGNLLMDLTVMNGQSPLLLDFSFAPTSTSRFHWTGALGVDSPVSALPDDAGGQWGGHVLQFTVDPPQPALTTPFFWDEFSRDTLPTDGLDWDPSSAASVTVTDGSAVIESLSDDYPGIFVDHPQVKDFSIRAQLHFDGSFSAQINPWIGTWARDETSGDGFSPGGYWGGVGANGILYIGKTLRGLTDNDILDQVPIMTPAEVRDNDIHYQFDAVGDQISVRAWLDGTEMPDEPQLTITDSEYTLAAMSGIFINPSSNLTGFSVESFALLPAVEGDFSANDVLDVDDIDLLSQEIRNGGTNRALDLQFLPDGKRLASSDFARSLRIWSLTEGSPDRPIKNLHSPSMNIFAVTVDAKRSWLLFGDARGNVNIYDSNSYEPVDQFRLETDGPNLDNVETLSVNDPGTRLAIGMGTREGGTVFVREFADQRNWLLAELPGTARAMFAADNELFVGGTNLDEIRVYHLGEASKSDATRFESIPLGAHGCSAIAMSPDMTLLALGIYDKGQLGESYHVEIWSTLLRQRLWTRQMDHRVQCVAFSPSGKQLAWGDQSGRAALAEVSSDPSQTQLVMSRKVSGSMLNDVSFSPDEQQLATSSADAFTMIWDLSILRDGARQVVKLNRDFVFASGGCFLDRMGRQAAVTCRNVGLVIWDSRTGSVIAEKQSSAETDLRPASFVKVASAADIGIACVVLGQWPFEPGDKTPVLIWDNTLRDFVGNVDLPVCAANSPSSCHMSPDGKFLAVSTQENGAYIINVERRQIHCVLDIASKSVRFSADGRTFACGLSNGLVQLYSMPEFRPQERLQMDQRVVDCIDLSSDGRMLAAVGFDRVVKLYNRDTQELKAFEDQLPVFPCLVRFSPDGERILTGSLDGKMRLWITETGDQLLNWRFKADSWPVAEFSQAGDTILVAGVEICHAIHAPEPEQLQQLPVSTLRSRACQQAPGED